LSSGTKQNKMLKIVTLKSGNCNKTLKNSCRLKKKNNLWHTTFICITDLYYLQTHNLVSRFTFS